MSESESGREGETTAAEPALGGRASATNGVPLGGSNSIGAGNSIGSGVAELAEMRSHAEEEMKRSKEEHGAAKTMAMDEAPGTATEQKQAAAREQRARAEAKAAVVGTPPGTPREERAEAGAEAKADEEIARVETKEAELTHEEVGLMLGLSQSEEVTANAEDAEATALALTEAGTDEGGDARGDGKSAEEGEEVERAKGGLVLEAKQAESKAEGALVRTQGEITALRSHVSIGGHCNERRQPPLHALQCAHGLQCRTTKTTTAPVTLPVGAAALAGAGGGIGAGAGAGGADGDDAGWGVCVDEEQEERREHAREREQKSEREHAREREQEQEQERDESDAGSSGSSQLGSSTGVVSTGTPSQSPSQSPSHCLLSCPGAISESHFDSMTCLEANAFAR
jgi:hypothetical protein